MYLITFAFLFQDVNLTWNTTSPDFTLCFERTVFVWTPCAFLWVFSCIETFYLIKSKTRDVPFSFTNVSKLVRVIAVMIKARKKNQNKRLKKHLYLAKQAHKKAENEAQKI